MKRVIIILFLSCIAFFGNSQVKTDLLVSEIFGSEGEKYFEIYTNSPNDIKAVINLVSVDNVEADRVFAYASKSEFEAFLALGLNYRILPHPGDLDYNPKMLSGIDIRDIEEWDFYPTYEAYLDMMEQFATDYPDICHTFSIGQSIQGREIMFARISDNVGINEAEPQFLYTSTMHGDETAGYVLMLRLIDYLLSNYGTNDRITDMVDGIDIWINPNANPDGTYAGGNNTVNGARRYNANWIDINRNFPDPEEGPHPDGNDWQQETMVFMELAEDNHFVSSANLHGGQEVCNYPWDTWSRLSADDIWWENTCREYADTVHLYCTPGYMSFMNNGITNGYVWYRITGGRQDYMNYFQQCREFTLEISDIKLLPPSQLPAHWEWNYRSLLNYMEECTYGIRGVIKDSVSGWPIEAEAYIIGHEQDSSWVYSRLPNGNYHRLVYDGIYNLRITAPGYITQLISGIQVNYKEPTWVNVNMVPEGVGGIEQNSISESVDVYPNPVAVNQVRVHSEHIVKYYRILDVKGRYITKQSVYDTDFTIPVHELDKGTYFIMLETEKGAGVKRLMVQ